MISWFSTRLGPCLSASARLAVLAIVGDLSLATADAQPNGDGSREIPPATATTPRPAAEDPPPGKAAEGPGDPESTSIAQLIIDLDADRYSIREAASQQLLARGKAAISQLVSAAEGQNVEVAARAAGALEDLWNNGDPEDSLAALQAMAHLDNQVAFSRRAREAVAKQKQIEAVAHLRGLGARTTDSTTRQPGQPEQPNLIDPNWIVFGESWKGAGEDLKRLTDIQSLQRVSFYSAPVTREEVAVLAAVPGISRLELYGTGLGEEDVAAIRGMLLGVSVDVRSGALLGVSGDVAAGVARINGVEPKSAAEQAGLKPGDVIAEVDGDDVSDFAELTTKIGTCQPGETADLVVFRDGQRLEIEVKFGQWR